MVLNIKVVSQQNKFFQVYVMLLLMMKKENAIWQFKNGKIEIQILQVD